jgi:predicted nucleotidyltransferase
MDVDYLHTIEALVPGARGQVLAALTRDTSVRTLRQVALAAEVSWSQTAQVVDDLADLGIVERRQTPGATLVRLVPGNVGAELLRSLTDLRVPATDALRRVAASIAPAPLNLTVFGSFARGEARRDSDIDVVAVHPSFKTDGEDNRWYDSVGRWVDEAMAITGNPVNLIDLGGDELLNGQQAAEWVEAAVKEGVTLAGRPLAELVGTDRKPRKRRG